MSGSKESLPKIGTLVSDWIRCITKDRLLARAKYPDRSPRMFLWIGGTSGVWPLMLVLTLALVRRLMWELGFPTFSGQRPNFVCQIALFQGSIWKINQSFSFSGFIFQQALSESLRGIRLTEYARSGTDRPVCKPRKGAAEAK